MLWTLLLLLTACDGGATPSDSTFCDDLVTEQPSCMNDDNLAECKAAVEDCGDEGVAVMESCPLQFGC